jgi:hypothetical protein
MKKNAKYGSHRSDCAFGLTSNKDLQMRYEKNQYQWPNAESTFFDCHLSFFTGKRRYECCACLLIAQFLQFLLFSMAKGGTKTIAHLSIAEGLSFLKSQTV